MGRLSLGLALLPPGLGPVYSRYFMLPKMSGIGGLLCLILSATGLDADIVTNPTRLFGLGEVRLIAVSPDLKFLATAGQGGGFLWDVPTATLRKRLEGDWSVTALAFSPHSNLLATASRRTIVAWDPESGVRVQEFVGHQGDLTRLRFSPDGQWLISASADNTVRVWSVETGAELRSIRVRGSPMVDVAISPDGQRLATVDTFFTNGVKIWDIATETLLRALPKTNWTAQRCVFTPDGHLLTTGADRSVQLWNAETAEEIRSFPGVTGATAVVLDLWTPNESTLGAACSDGSVYLWNLESAALIHVIPGEPVLDAIGIPDDFLSIAATLDYNVRIRQLPDGDTRQTFKGHTTSVHSGVAFSPDGQYVLSGGTESATRLWNRASGQPVREFIGSPDGTMAAAFSPDGSRILTTIGLPNPGARLWRTETGEIERDFPWTGSWPMSAVFSPDGTKIAARPQGGSIHVFDVATGALTKTLANGAFGGPLAFSPTAPLLAVASADFGVDLYHYESGQRLHTFSAHAGPATVVAFSPVGEVLMIGWLDGLIHLYHPSTTELLREFPVPAAFLETAAFSPDGQYILTGDGWPRFTATLWDAQTARPLRTFAGHQWSVSAVAFSRDGASILTGAEIVREWSIADIQASLRIEKLPEQIRLSWSLGELQQAVDLEGPWLTVTNAVSPFSLPSMNSTGFFRNFRSEGETASDLPSESAPKEIFGPR